MLVIGITGSRGRLGKELVGMGCVPILSDITDRRALQKELDEIEPDVVINCAAITDVDGCEEVEMERKATKVNGYGVAMLREAFDGYLIHISTDYIFDGRSGPYAENAKPNPISAYGFTKYVGEISLQKSTNPNYTIVRTTMLYGGDKPDFVSKTLEQLKVGMDFYIPAHLCGSPTYVPHLSQALMGLAYLPERQHIIHIAGTEVISRYEFAIQIANVFGYDYRRIHPVEEVPGKAWRPLKAGLKLKLAEKLGLPLFSPLAGLVALKNKMEVPA